MGETLVRVAFCRICSSVTPGEKKKCALCGSAEVVGATATECRPDDAQVRPVADGADIEFCGSRFHHAATGQDVRTDDWPPEVS